jgi:hypothetical protein
MGKRCREVTYIAWGHGACKVQTWDWSLALDISKSMILTPEPPKIYSIKKYIFVS